MRELYKEIVNLNEITGGNESIHVPKSFEMYLECIFNLNVIRVKISTTIDISISRNKKLLHVRSLSIRHFQCDVKLTLNKIYGCYIYLFIVYYSCSS